MQSRHGNLAHTDRSEPGIDVLFRVHSVRTQGHQLREGPVVPVSNSECSVPVGAPSEELHAAVRLMGRDRPLDCRVVEIERRVPFNVARGRVDVGPLQEQLGRREVAVEQRAV